MRVLAPCPMGEGFGRRACHMSANGCSERTAKSTGLLVLTEQVGQRVQSVGSSATTTHDPRRALLATSEQPFATRGGGYCELDRGRHTGVTDTQTNRHQQESKQGRVWQNVCTYIHISGNEAWWDKSSGLLVFAPPSRFFAKAAPQMQAATQKRPTSSWLRCLPLRISPPRPASRTAAIKKQGGWGDA